MAHQWAHSIMNVNSKFEEAGSEEGLDDYYYLRARLYRFMEDLDKWLDPYEMIHIGVVSGTPIGIYLQGAYKYPPRFWDIANESFAGFIAFSGWTYTAHALPPDWKSKRHEIESRWPQRRALLNHIEVRIHDAILEHPDHLEECVKYYSDKAKERWRTLRDHVTTMRITNYWVHAANKPWSAGFMRGLKECSAGDWSES